MNDIKIKINEYVDSIFSGTTKTNVDEILKEIVINAWIAGNKSAILEINNINALFDKLPAVIENYDDNSGSCNQEIQFGICKNGNGSYTCMAYDTEDNENGVNKIDSEFDPLSFNAKTPSEAIQMMIDYLNENNLI